MEKIEIELISFGNELLIGEIVDTNSQWLALVLSKAGVIVKRMSTISDDLDDISDAFVEVISRKPHIIISTGGLGPTWDDQTLIGLSKAVKKRVVQNKIALNMIQEKYKELNMEMSPAGMKMANMPDSSFVLSNREGTAPGVQFHLKNISIFCLPGIPKEMQVIFNDHILPYIRKLNPNIQFYDKKFSIKNSYESKLAEITSKFAKIYPSIHIKSHPKKNIIKMHLTTYGTKKEKILLENVTRELIKAISTVGLVEDLE